ncbi:hypothetical protein LTR84_000702 [Exophiala bonariae]|uniref:Arrestin-like N-terminal domain-containing protein n=1 Tax=Exophiala bonariae TaxID=1690606 RepID=A0AAV9NV09_9EURO|nr:hypothetical protein LTR84_000702 [Exophiala bonariae]
MKLEYNIPQGCTNSLPWGFSTPTICLWEPINIEISLEDDDMDMVGLETRLRLIGAIHLDRYQSVVRHGTVEFTGVHVHTDEILNISKSVVLKTRRTSTTIDLTSLGVDVSQLPSSLDIVGHSSRDEDQLLSTEAPMQKLSVRYRLSVETPSKHGRKKHSQRELRVLGTSLSQRECRLEVAMLWPKAGYSDTLSLQQSTKHLQFLKLPCSCPPAPRSLVVDVLSYEPFIIQQQTEFATAKIVLGLKYSLTSHEQGVPSYPFMSASWTLQSTTEMLNPPFNHQETSIKLHDAVILSGAKHKITSSNWHQAKSEADEVEWTDKQELCLAAPIRRFFAPTFFSDKLQHTYNLKLKMCSRLPGGIFGHRTQSMEFNLPVTVVNEAPGYGSDQSPPGYEC